MITKKEDLINTYIENDHGELRDLYLARCEEFGLYVGGIDKGSDTIGVLDRGGESVWHGFRKSTKDSCKQLTLSDLKPNPLISKGFESAIKETVSDQFSECVKKTPIYTPSFNFVVVDVEKDRPRTKVEYEKVEFEPNEIWKAFKEHQEVGFLYVKTLDEYECLLDGVFNLAMAISQGDQLYRKVERPVEWWEDAVEFVRENACNMNAIARDLVDDGLYVEAKMTRDQWCDFARILLEQEGE